jgi:hypothetical protein
MESSFEKMQKKNVSEQLIANQSTEEEKKDLYLYESDGEVEADEDYIKSDEGNEGEEI